MKDKSGLADRISSLGLDIRDIRDIKEIQLNYRTGKTAIIPNVEGKRASIAIYYAITTDNKIGVEQAKRGLEIYGEELRQEAKQEPGKHPNIDILEEIISGNLQMSSIIKRGNNS